MSACECGCGGATGIIPATRRKQGLVKGEHYRFIHNHHTRYRNVPACGYTVDEATGCWVWGLSTNADGYGLTERTLAHRLLYERHVGPIPEGMELDHLCRVRLCVNPAHMEPVTHLENVRRGASTKLTDEQVAAIREDRRLQRVIAAEYGITQSHVSSIKLGKQRAAA